MSTTMAPLDIAMEDIAPFEKGAPPHAKAHIVNPPANTHIWAPGMTMQEVVDIARMTGQEVVALCGHRWVPKLDPAALDVCETCLDRAHRLLESEARR